MGVASQVNKNEMTAGKRLKALTNMADTALYIHSDTNDTTDCKGQSMSSKYKDLASFVHRCN